MSQNISPAAGASSITPSDATTFNPTRGLYVAVKGDVKVDMISGDTVTFADLAAGIIHPLQVVRVYSTGTTATGIIGLT